MRIFGIEFAPYWIPRQRRQETFSVFFWMFTFMFSTLFMGPFFILFFILFHTRYWYLGVAYITWMIYDRRSCARGGRSGFLSRWVRNWGMWKNFANFFPITMIKTADLDPSRNYLFCSHPHGVLSAGAFCCFATEGTHFSKVFPGLKPHLLTLEALYQVPFFRELWYSTSGCAATKESMEHLLTGDPPGHVAVLVPGGAPESLNCDRGEVRIILNPRKGFVKLALRSGSCVVPTFSFGEHTIYDKAPNPQGSWIRAFQEKAQQIFGFAPVFFMGRGIFQYSFGIVPYRKPIIVVIGAPIEVTKTENPSNEEIEIVHAKYVEAIQNLYKTYNDAYGDPSVKLVIT